MTALMIVIRLEVFAATQMILSPAHAGQGLQAMGEFASVSTKIACPTINLFRLPIVIQSYFTFFQKIVQSNAPVVVKARKN